MVSLEHTNDIDQVAVVEPATKRTVTAPVVHQTPCRCCDAVISHLGDLAVTICDGCLDVLSGDVEAYVPRRKRVLAEVDNDEAWQRQPVAVEHDPVDIDIVVRVPRKLRNEIFGEAAVQAEQSSEAMPANAVEVDTKVLCKTCVNMTSYKCKCGCLCCYECVDALGRCPACDGEEA